MSRDQPFSHSDTTGFLRLKTCSLNKKYKGIKSGHFYYKSYYINYKIYLQSLTSDCPNVF